jgi:hypothetical protein
MINTLPALVNLNNEAEYRKYYENKYCNKNITTFDGIRVRFYEEKFDDAFFESSNKLKRNKDIFSIERAKRIDWIEYVLKDSSATLHLGWDRDTKSYNKNRRVAIINKENYVVIIEVKSKNDAKFITAYYADTPRTATNIKNSPLWKWQ